MKIRAFFKLVIVVVFFIIAYAICDLAPYYVNATYYKDNELRLVIDDKEYTKSTTFSLIKDYKNNSGDSGDTKKYIKPDIPFIVDGKVMISMKTIKECFDKYIYFDEKYQTVIVAKGTDVIKMPLGEKTIIVNSNEKIIEVPAQYIDDKIYIPIEELKNIYNIEISVNEKVVITTKDAEYYKVKVGDEIKLKKFKRQYCKTIDVIKTGETIDVFDKYEEKSGDSYLWVRAANGSFGYVKKDDIAEAERTYVNNKEIPSTTKKISLIWEYAANYTPNRNGQTKHKGMSIISPTWIYVSDENGKLKNTIDTSYIEWAKSVGYEIWPTIKNDLIGIKKTSTILNDMNLRQAFIDNVVSLAKKYNFKGINLDFENMYMKDRDVFAQLVRELSSALRANGIISSVDVNVPDGSETWSLCYDSKAISDATDYTILMAYDQHGSSSKIAGSVASLDWVELNLQKMIERDGIDSTKLVLGVPFYSRFWRVRNGAVVSTSSMTMKNAKNYMEKYKNFTEWVEESGQYVVRYKDKKDDIEIWIENEDSLKEKLKLISKYKLAGFAAWRWGFENDETWSLIGK